VTERPPPDRCVHLRTKSWYLNPPQPGDAENPYPTATWWCARTREALGPDGATARPGPCDAPGRRCHEAPVRL
jgi:hypothetical protein